VTLLSFIMFQMSSSSFMPSIMIGAVACPGCNIQVRNCQGAGLQVFSFPNLNI
jgi:hypothetical protein